jgi:hypothetical protein
MGTGLAVLGSFVEGGVESGALVGWLVSLYLPPPPLSPRTLGALRAPHQRGEEG